MTQLLKIIYRLCCEQFQGGTFFFNISTQQKVYVYSRMRGELLKLKLVSNIEGQPRRTLLMFTSSLFPCPDALYCLNCTFKRINNNLVCSFSQTVCNTCGWYKNETQLNTVGKIFVEVMPWWSPAVAFLSSTKNPVWGIITQNNNGYQFSIFKLKCFSPSEQLSHWTCEGLQISCKCCSANIYIKKKHKKKCKLNPEYYKLHLATLPVYHISYENMRSESFHTTWHLCHV